MGIGPRALLCVGGAALALSAICAKYAPAPLIWILLLWTMAMSYLAWRTARAGVRAALINFAAVSATLVAMETYAYWSVTSDSSIERTYSAGYKERDDVLGTAPARGVVGRSTLVHRGRVVYDTTYTIGPDGLRIEPPVAADAPQGCVLFFGDSFTFGEGLHDDETMPYRVALDMGRTWRVYNFSFHGYGAQHMLAALEHGRVDEVLGCAPTHVIYEAITDHPARAAGLYAWSRSAPRYELQSDGSVVQRGHFDDAGRNARPSAWHAELAYQLDKSFLVKWLANRHRPVNESDVRLWAAIVAATKDLVGRKYPGAQFDVLLWGSRDDPETYRSMRAALTRAGIRFHLVDQILPDYPRTHAEYEIDPLDTHPNAKADSIIAGYVATKILERR